MSVSVTRSGISNQPVQHPCCGAQPLALALYRTMHGSSICSTAVRPTKYNTTPSEAVSHDPNQTNVRGLTSARTIMQRQPTALRGEYDWNPGTRSYHLVPTVNLDRSMWAQTYKLMPLARDPNPQLGLPGRIIYLSVAESIVATTAKQPHHSPSASEVDSS
jgi:hypothetical protein